MNRADLDRINTFLAERDTVAEFLAAARTATGASITIAGHTSKAPWSNSFKIPTSEAVAYFERRLDTLDIELIALGFCEAKPEAEGGLAGSPSLLSSG